MKNIIKKLKGKKVLSMLLALIMVLSVASPAISPLSALGIKAKAATTFPVELAFNNLFIFEEWATNSLSSTVIIDGTAQTDEDLLQKDIDNGSFTLTKKNMAAAETYTAFSMSTDDALFNSKYYNIPVEPNTEYVFSYHVTGNTYAFTPFVFFYTSDGLYNNLVAYPTPKYETNNFKFTTPDNVTAVQVRFTITDSSSGAGVGNSGASSVYATVKDIAIYKADMYDAYFEAEEAELATQKETQNLFKFNDWASKATSLPCGLGTTGTIEPDAINKTVKFTTRANAGESFFTPLGIDQTASNVGFYTMTVSPNTTYSLTYDIGANSLPGAVHCQPWIVEMNSDGVALSYFNYETPGLTNNRKDFTTSAKTTQIQLVFNIINDAQAVSRYCVVENIGVHKTDFLNSLPTIDYNIDFKTIAGHTHRAAYSYTTGSDNGTYGELPTPSYVPEGQVFAGWYTGKDGAGEYISAETPVSYSSYTVYPKYEPEIKTLSVDTQPSKTDYTIGEKLNTAGLVLEATQDYTIDVWTDKNGNEIVDEGEMSQETHTDTFKISSGYRYSPEYLTSTGTQTITVSYGGQTATFNVNVTDGIQKDIAVNGATQAVTVANNKYIFNPVYNAGAFNRYELSYYSDSYVKGAITMDGIVEEFFLEPSDNGSFASYIDSFLRGVSHYTIESIEFTCLDKEFGNFELKSVTTINATVPSDPTQYYQNDEYKVGISLDYGGVVSYIEDLDDDVSAAVYNENGKDITRVDYTSKLPSGAIATSNSVNLINTNDRGRYLQQSYYGTDQPPYEMGSYNGLPWSYNPVQGGNINIFDPNTGKVVKGGEASKVVDYRITADQIYIKTRPLDWGKNSEDYPDSYVTDSYMEAWYTFENGMIKTNCRFVDYSGYPSNTTTQEYPALYTIEPLNHFVYNETTDTSAWDAASVAWQTEGMKNIEEPDFWGVLPEYNELLKQNGKPTVDVNVDCHENWAAFTASADTDSFGIGVYSAGITDFHYGVFPAIYNEDQVKNGSLVENYRHAQTLDPAVESPTSYISPVGTMTFESYKPSTYSFYVTTGTADQIREDFRKVETIESGEALAQTKVAVPETVYMLPSNGTSTVGEIYVNNILDANDFYNVKTLAEREDAMYFGMHIADAAYFTVDVSNATDPSNDINLCKTDGSAVSTAEQFEFDPNDNYINDIQYGLKFSGTGLNPGEKATAKWDITVKMDDGSTQKYTYYTVMYAPGRTVGAVAEGRKEDISQNEISSWITGANGVDHSQRSPLGSFHGDKSASGYFIEDPLVYDRPLTSISSTGETPNDLINVADEYSENAYVLQTATNGHDHSRAQSYLGLLKVDKSRYTNTNQIPNLEIGYDVLRLGSNAGRSFANYYTFYVLGTNDSFTSTDVRERPSGWTSFATTTNSDSTIPARETVVPSYNVSEIDGKYIHALNQARCWYIMNAGETTGNSMDLNSYSTAGTSVLCSVTDKSALRESVLTGYGITNTDPQFDEALEKAATVLGDPSASQESIDEAKKELNDAMQEKVDVYYALKYDNIFSAYEMSQYAASMKVVSDRGTATYSNGTITVKNDTITGGEAYTTYGSANDYYHVDLKPNTEYVFEYDVTSDVKSQAFMFFYNSAGGAGDVPTNMSIKTNGGAWSSKSEANAWFGNYGNAGTYHYAIKFTTGANTTQASFRFGNTTNDPCTSTFSNIKLVESSKYYEDVVYSKTEDTYKEYASYGTLPTLSRTGYTFVGWSDVENVGITGATIATKHRTIYSQWEEYNYTIAYNANGGSGSIPSQSARYSQEVTLPSTGFTYAGYTLVGWSTDSAATSAEYIAGTKVSKLTETNGATVTLYAVWAKSDINVTFDNLIDIRKWEEEGRQPGSASATFSDTAITLASTSTAGEGTFESHEFPVTAGKEYKIDIDITGNNWDVYIFFRSETVSGTGIDFNDGKNRFSSGGAGNASRVFTAPAGATKAVIRIDANNASNTVVFDNIRVWENNGITVSPVNKIVANNKQYGTLPTPTRPGYEFAGWKNEGDQWVLATSVVNSTQTVNLYSQWSQKPYGIHFSTNGGTGECPNISVKYEEEFVLYENLTSDGAKFLGWSTNQFALKAEYNPGDTVSVSRLEGADISKTDITLYAVWELTSDSVIDDSVVVDFNLLSVSVNPYINDTGIFSYHVTETEFVKSYDFGFSTNDGKDLTLTDTGAYGNFSIDKGSYSVIYTPNSIMGGVDQVNLYTKLTYKDGTEKILTNIVEAAPASNMYYEESVISTGTGTANVDWNVVSNSATLSTKSNIGVYGHDDYYENSTQFSNSSYYSVSVDSINKRSETASFTFTGTGFDLIAACGANTGVQLVNIKQNGKLIKGYIVDTYYDTSEENPIVGTEELIYQTPIVNWTGDYGTYTVEITSYYLASSAALQPKTSFKSFVNNDRFEKNSAQPQSAAGIEQILEDAGLSTKDVELVWFDDNSILNGGTGAAPTKKSSRAFAKDANDNLILYSYIDGIRIYNTLNKDSSKYSAEEKNAVYANVVNSLVTSGDTVTSGIAYMYGNKADFTWATYQKKGPKGEIYLTGGNAVTFKLTVNPNEKVMIALRAVNGETTHTVNDVQFSIDSATEMYYDITNCIGTSGLSQQTKVLVTVRNTGSKILAINHIKVSGGDGTSGNGGVTPRSVTRFASSPKFDVIENRFLPITEEDVVQVQNSLSNKKIPGEVIDGVVMPIIEDEGNTPDAPNEGGEAEGGSSTPNDPFDVFSLFKWIIELIKGILLDIAGNKQLF